MEVPSSSQVLTEMIGGGQDRHLVQLPRRLGGCVLDPACLGDGVAVLLEMGHVVALLGIEEVFQGQVHFPE